MIYIIKIQGINRIYLLDFFIYALAEFETDALFAPVSGDFEPSQPDHFILGCNTKDDKLILL